MINPDPEKREIERDMARSILVEALQSGMLKRAMTTAANYKKFSKRNLMRIAFSWGVVTSIEMLCEKELL